MKPRVHLTYFVVAILALFVAQAALAQEAAPAAPAVGDEKMDVKDLELLLKPLTLADLEAEVDAWQEKLKVAATAYETAKVGDGTDATALSDARGAIAERLGVVLKAYGKKGGDEEKIAEVETYVGINSPGVVKEGEGLAALGKRAYNWLISPAGGLVVGLNILFFVLIIIGFKILAGILGGVVRRAVGKSKNLSALLQDFFVTMTKKIVFVIGLIVALGVLGFEMGAFVAAIGALGFIVAFALQGTLSNFASGLMILIYRPFDVGDVISVSGVIGKVNALSLVATTLKTPDNKTEIIPNNSVWGQVITNVTHEDKRRVDLVFGIGYGDDMDQAKAAMVGILEGHELVLSDPAPQVEVHELADSSVNFVCRPWCKTSDYWDVYFGITKLVKEKFDAEGISIPFPQQDVYMHTVEQ
ncbi:MAG: mechanosensitive ion channel family protein [Planctomycetota bacterium]